MIQRGDSAKYAKHVFFRALNDIDIFIEDTAVESKKIFVEILRRALGSHISLTQVFPIGTKSRVIARCSKDQGARNRGAVYIIDGDFDWLLGVAPPRMKRLYRLNRYCIENYLIDEEAIISILDEESVDLEEGEIRRRLGFNAWMTTISNELKGLTYAGSIGHNRRCGGTSVNFSLSELCSCSSGLVDPAKVSSKTVDLKNLTDAKHGVGTFDRDLAAMEKSHSLNAVEFMLRHTSGKSILLPLLKKRLVSLFSFAPKTSTFKLRLSMRCAVDDIVDIVKYIK